MCACHSPQSRRKAWRKRFVPQWPRINQPCGCRRRVVRWMCRPHASTLDALSALSRPKPAPAPPPEVLLIKPNEEARDIEALVQARPGPRPGLPMLPEHKLEGASA